jgi:4-aminobutyrate aminotransferase
MNDSRSNGLAFAISDNSWPVHEVLEVDAEFIGSSAKVRFNPFVPEGGQGSNLIDADGRSYIDFSGSSGAAALGYGHPGVLAAVQWESAKLTMSSLAVTAHKQSATLARRLCELTPGDHRKKVIFAATGSEASDYACTLARAATGRSKIVAFECSYHGTTTGSAAVSGHPALINDGSSDTILFPYPSATGPAEARDQILNDIERYFERAASETAAVIVEPIQSDGGQRVAPDGFLAGVAELCRQFGVYLIVDEVKTGLGRTGHLFASSSLGLVPDMLLLGKALGGGIPLSAVVGSAAIMDTAILLASTLGGSNVACAAANATLDSLTAQGFMSHVSSRGEQMQAELREIDSRVIREVRGRGLMIGVELGDDLVRGVPADRITAAVSLRAFELGLIVLCSGVDNNVIDITPPLVIEADEVSRGVQIIAQALEDVLSGRFNFAALDEYAGWGDAPSRPTSDNRAMEGRLQ